MNGATLSEKELKAIGYIKKYNDHNFFDNISERDKNIFELRTGINGTTPISFNDLSQVHNLTKQSCQQISVRTCRKIGKQVGGIESKLKRQQKCL